MAGRRIFAMVLLGLMTAPGWGQNAAQQQEKVQQEKVKNSSETSPDLAMPAPNVGPSYVIGIDDVLHISVWKEPDLTATLPVRPDGMISLPLLNDVQAAGLTPMQLSALLTERLKTYIATPRVTVVVTVRKAQQVFLLGEVQRHGAIPLLPDMTVLQALATAGFTQFANTKGIYILRVENGQQQKMPFNYKQAIKGETAALNIVLKPGDTIVVP